MSELIQKLLHADKSVEWAIHHFGGWIYLLLAGVLFMETGFVITPFLPGDTLLFAAGIFSHPERHALNLWIVLPVLTLGPLLGDTVNFHLGKWVGPHLFRNEKSKLFKKSYLDKTHLFFEKYGQKTIVLARWVPIVRTFSPFVAGLSQMPYRQFIGYSTVGAVIWVWVCVFAGYLFGGLPVVRDNFEIAMLGLVFVSLIPITIEYIKHRREKKAGGAGRIRTAE